MWYFIQQYFTNLINNILRNLTYVYYKWVSIFYDTLELIIFILKESLLIDFLQKLFCIKLLTTYLIKISIYFENCGLMYYINKILKLIYIDVSYTDNIWFNFFVKSYMIMFFINTCFVLYIFF